METGETGRWLRFSLTDVLFLAILCWTVILSPTGWSRLLLDADAGLHIRIGDYILQNGIVPTTDPLSFTQQGQHWLATEWLSGVIFSILNTRFGLKGVVFLCGVTIAVALTVLLRTCVATGANTFVSLIALLMATSASSVHFHSRPHVFTWLFLAIALHVLTMDAIRPGRRIWWLVPLTALWTNLHGGYAVLFPVIGIFLAGTALEYGYRSPRVLRYAGLAAACGVSSLINPFGYQLHVDTIHYLRSATVRNGNQEFLAPTFRTEPELCFMVLLFAGLALCGLLLARRRWTPALLMAAFGYLALTSVRHIPIYALVAIPVIAAEITAQISGWLEAQPRNSTPAILRDMSLAARERMLPLSVWSLVALGVILVWPSTSGWPKDFPADRFPVEIAARQSGQLAASRLYTTDQWADYLMYKNPAQRVFVDDRSFYDAQIISDALTLMDAGKGWRQLIDKYQVNAVLVPAGSALANVLAEDRRWILADQDAQRRLFKMVAQ
ncbi:MAG: hypothetical protein HY820_46205 [Acidobacteria bacterium]|nr:hypothetical protein [Acidobacteriota bacterium]